MNAHIEPRTTLQMYPGNHTPAGVIRYGCKCKTLTVIDRHDATWITKRCGRTLRITGDHVNLRVSHGELVGEHFNGRTTFPVRAVETLLRLIGHPAHGLYISSGKVKRTIYANMEGHVFYVPDAKTGEPARCSFGALLARPSETHNQV